MNVFSRRRIRWLMLLPVLAQAQVVAPQTEAPFVAPYVTGDETFLRGIAAFEARDFTTALRLFQDAYIATRSPDVLRNVAVTLERLDRPDDAVSAYTRYLSTATDIPDRPALEQRVALLRTDAARRMAASPPRPPSTSGSIVAQPSSSPPTPIRPLQAAHNPSVGSLVVLASGAVVFGSSGIFYALREGALSVCTHSNGQYVCPTASLDQVRSDAPMWNTLTNVALIVGPVLMVGGAAWLTLDVLRRPREASHPSARVWVAPTIGGLSISAEGIF